MTTVGSDWCSAHNSPPSVYCHDNTHGFVVYATEADRQKIRAFMQIKLQLAGWKGVIDVRDAEAPVPDKLYNGEVPEGYEPQPWMRPDARATPETRAFLVIAEIE